MWVISTSRVREEEDGFGTTSVVVRCTLEERQLLRRLVDQYHSRIDIFSLRECGPDLVELGTLAHR